MPDDSALCNNPSHAAMVSAHDVGRLFLQAMISRRVVSEQLAQVLLRQCIAAVGAANRELDIDYQFPEQITSLNNGLEPLDLKLVTSVDEVTGKAMLALINLKSDELAQMATEYTPTEIAYFRALVEHIVLASSNSYSVSSMTALREASNLKGSMTKTQAEAVLASLVASGWLLKSRRGRYSLSARSLLEVQTYLKDNYDDCIHECVVCYEYVTKGVGCHVKNCSARLHRHCYANYARSAEGRVCTSCKQDWTDPDKLLVIGENALKDGEDSARIRRRDDEGTAESEEEGEEEEEEEEDPRVNANKHVQEAEGDDSEGEMEAEDTPPPRARGKR